MKMNRKYIFISIYLSIDRQIDMDIYTDQCFVLCVCVFGVGFFVCLFVFCWFCLLFVCCCCCCFFFVCFFFWGGGGGGGRVCLIYLYCLVGCLSMIVWTHAVLGVLHACVFYFCIFTCLAQLSMFHMERRSRNTIIILITLSNATMPLRLYKVPEAIKHEVRWKWATTEKSNRDNKRHSIKAMYKDV